MLHFLECTLNWNKGWALYKSPKMNQWTWTELGPSKSLQVWAVNPHELNTPKVKTQAQIKKTPMGWSKEAGGRGYTFLGFLSCCRGEETQNVSEPGATSFDNEQTNSLTSPIAHTCHRYMLWSIIQLCRLSSAKNCYTWGYFVFFCVVLFKRFAVWDPMPFTPTRSLT